MIAAGLPTFIGSAEAQNYLSASGSPTFVSPEAVEQGFTDAANGNLHLEFALGSYPQRGGQTETVKYVYDSDMVWNAGCSASGCSWAPSNTNNYGWRLATAGGSLTGLNCGGSGCPDWAFTDMLGTTRYFHVTLGTCPVPNAYASDSSGYMMNLCQTGVYAPDGTLVYSSTYMQQAAPGVEDSNGNYVNPGSNYYGDGQDTLGRTLPNGIQSCNSNANQLCFQVPNSQGTLSTYTVTTTSISVHTNFVQSGVTEFTGTMTAVQSLALPDGTSYTFKYDCDSGSGNPVCGSPPGQGAYYGLVMSMTLPTGGVVTYGYTTFSDSYSNKVEWLNSRVTAGGTWSYQPQVISTCTSTQVGCQQKVTVSLPSGDSRVYTFTLNNGAWPVTIQDYDATSALLSTTTNTYDFSQPCNMINCHGAAFVRLSTTQTTISAPGGNLTKQTQYYYDNPQTGNLTQKSEWGYYPGGLPAVPDRATYINYLNTGTNDINRPLSVTVCNNSGSDSACPGGGTRVQQTLYTYDQYSSIPSPGCPGGNGLSSVSGVMNHDDALFGSGYTTRGNVTQIQQWVSGSTYLSTYHCYDTTGQITEDIDPKGNVTSYLFADKLYSDNGTNSPTAYSPSKPTNAYVTTVQQPLIGTTTFGYYYGSGKQAFSTDPNNISAYSHFMDPFDRSTENDYFSVGWDKTAYPSPTQSDIYSSVGDTSPSTSCQSCQHRQVIMDVWGRKTSEKIPNYPGGSVSVDTGYDANGRTYSVSHPYQGSSGQVYEYYHYDGLDRTIKDTHPDNQYLTAFFGPDVAANGGVTSQQASPSTYGYGYPVLYRDEAGNKRQEWIDGFGRVIEIDEPVATSATRASGSVNINTFNGVGDQQVTIGGSPSHVALTVAGGEQSFCTGECLRTTYDTGSVTVTVNGCTTQTTYGKISTPSNVAYSLYVGFSCGTVTASLNGTTITFTSVASGSTTNSYAWSTSASSNYYSQLGGVSFWASPNGSYTESASGYMSGGTDPTTVYDSGSVQITVNGEMHSVSYGQGSTASGIASALASVFAGSSNVTASTSGATVSFTSVSTGGSTDYSVCAGSSTSQGQYFSNASFTTSPEPPCGSLSGGFDAGTPLQLATLYGYDADDHVTQVLQGIQSRTYGFDGLGRPTAVSTPEAGTDSLAYAVSGALCSGDPGNICQKTDARGVITNYYYDALNRLVGKSYTIPQGSGVAAMPNVCTTSTGQSANVCYTYDQGGAAAFALGRRTQMIDPSGSESYTYDQAGRITQLTKVIGSRTYTIGYQYNAADEVTQITYPSGRKVQRSYNAVGQLCAVAGQTSGCTTFTTPYATGYTYNANGQLTGFNYGNGVAAGYAYSTNRSQLSSLSYTKGTSTLFSLSYWYQQDGTNCPSGPSANNALIQCITDNVDSGRTANYAYDVLGRISSAVTNGSAAFPRWGLSWSYDRYGNRLNQTLTAGSGYQNFLTFSNPGGAQKNQPDGWCFDSSGNLLSESCPAVNPIVYDGEDHMVSDPAAGAAYVYDGSGRRVEKCLPNCTSPSSTSVYISAAGEDIAEYDNGVSPISPSREFVYTDGAPGSGLLVSIVGSFVTYFHSDHLGWRVSTDVNGNVNGQQGQYPFGQSWYSSNGNQFVFTSYQHDTESGLDYAVARYYDSGVARFCTVDPQGGQLGDPQTWNRYAYARNDPVNLVDPSGEGFWSWFVDIVAGIAAAFIPEIAPELFGAAESSLQVGEITTTTFFEGSVIGTSTAPVFGQLALTQAIAGAAAGGVVAAATQTGGPAQPQTPQQKFTDCNRRFGDANSRSHLDYQGFQNAEQAAQAAHITPSQELAIWDNENALQSTFPPVPATGEVGPIQIRPPAVQALKSAHNLPQNWNTNVVANLTAGGNYFSMMLRSVGAARAAAAYNAGARGARLGRGQNYQRNFNRHQATMQQLVDCMH